MRDPVGFTRLLVQFRPREDFRGSFAIDLELVDPLQPEARGVRRSATVEIEVRMPVAVAGRNLRRGEILDEDAIRFETRELRGLPDDVVTDAARAEGQTLRVSVREGSPLITGYFAAEDIVKRGDVLQIEAGQNGLTLRLEARALQAGALGEVIRAQNPTSKRELRVEITGPREARLAQADVGMAR
jgi:flagellar basal body P-ring formation protein FlgA